jgi:hypothetical protein
MRQRKKLPIYEIAEEMGCSVEDLVDPNPMNNPETKIMINEVIRLCMAAFTECLPVNQRKVFLLTVGLNLPYKLAAFATGSCKIIFCHEYGSCRVIEGGECRNPEYARPSLEANGVNVNELNKMAGWAINLDTNEVDNDRVSMGAVYGLVLIG